MLRLIYVLMSLCCLLIPSFTAQAATAVGTVETVNGDARVERSGSTLPITEQQQVFESDVIITGDMGRVKLLMADNSKVYVGSKTKISLQQYAMNDKGLFKASLDLAWGKARFFVNKLVSKKSSFEVKTSTAVLGVRGTGWLTEVSNNQTRITQFEGVLSVKTLRGEFSVSHGQFATINQAGVFQVRSATRQEMSLQRVDPDVGDHPPAADQEQSQHRPADAPAPHDDDPRQQGDQSPAPLQQGDEHPAQPQPNGASDQGSQPPAAKPDQKTAGGLPPASTPPPAAAPVVPDRPKVVLVPDAFVPATGAANGSHPPQGASTAQPSQGGTQAKPAPVPVPNVQQQPAIPPAFNGAAQNAIQQAPQAAIQNAVQQATTTVNIAPQFVLP